MPSLLNSTNLEDTYRHQFSSIFFYILQKILVTNDAIVAGGAVLAPYDKTGKTRINDLDIYVHERNAQSLVAQLTNIKLTPDALFGFISDNQFTTMMSNAEFNPNNITKINPDEGITSDNIELPLFNFEVLNFSTTLQPPYDRSFFVKNNILLRLPISGIGYNSRSPIGQVFNPRRFRQFPQIKIDILVVDDRVPLTSVPENFDLSFCKVWWNGTEVWATNPDDIENKTGTLSPDYVLTLLQGNTYTLNRVAKYKKRGYKVTIPSMRIPEQVLEKSKKQVISDERWLVSKILDQIQMLFNDVRNLRYAYRGMDIQKGVYNCFDNKKEKFIDEIAPNYITKYNRDIFLLDALKNFIPDYNGPIFTMENINNLYVNLFEFLELDLEGLRLLLLVNTQVPECTDVLEESNNAIRNIYIPLKERFIEEIKTIFYKMWAFQEGADDPDEFRRKNSAKEVPENIKKEVLHRFFQRYIINCKLGSFKNILFDLSLGPTRKVILKYLRIINNSFPVLDKNNKLDELIMDSNFLMNDVLQQDRKTDERTCNYSPYICFLVPEYIYIRKYKDTIEDPRISYSIYRNNSCSVPIKGYVKPIPKFGGSVEPNQVFDTREQCQEYKKQLLTEQQRRTAEARQKALAEYGDLTDPDVSGNVDDFAIPGGTWGVDEIPGKCYRAEDSGKDLSKNWYEKGNILFLMHFSEIDPNQEDLTVCVSQEYLEERMRDRTNIYYTCTGPRAEILNGDRRGQIIPYGEVEPEDRYDRLPSGGPDAANVNNVEETFVKINFAEEQLRNEKGEKTVDTTVPAYLRINDVRKIIQIVSENPDTPRVFSLLPDGERTHTVTKSVMDGESVVGGFHCQNNSVINIFKVREFVPKTGAAGEWRDIPPLAPSFPLSPPLPRLTRQIGINRPFDSDNEILTPFTGQEEGTEISEEQRLLEGTNIDEQGVARQLDSDFQRDEGED